MTRKNSIGGSDIASILGISPWKSCYELYLEKIGVKEEEPDNEWFKAGREAEKEILDDYDKLYGVSIQRNVAIASGEYPFLVGNLDGLDREKGIVVEAKTTRLSIDKFKTDKGGLPDFYKSQVAFYMYLTDCTKARVITAYNFINGVIGDLHIFEVSRDFDYETQMISKVLDFWELVKNRTPPAAVTHKDIKLFNKTAIPGSILEVDYDTYLKVKKLSELQEERNLLKAEIETLEMDIKRILGKNEYMSYDKMDLCRWSAAIPRRFRII